MVRNERVSDKIKRQLVFGGALTDQIKVACKESKSKKLRRAVKKIVFGEVTKMYKCFSRIRKDIGLGENPKKLQNKCYLKYTWRSVGATLFLREKIVNFYETKGRMLPGKKDCRKKVVLKNS